MCFLRRKSQTLGHDTFPTPPIGHVSMSSTESRTCSRCWVTIECIGSILPIPRQYALSKRVLSAEYLRLKTLHHSVNNHLSSLLMHSCWWDSGLNWNSQSFQTHLPHSGSCGTYWSHCIFGRIRHFRVNLEWLTAYLGAGHWQEITIHCRVLVMICCPNPWCLQIDSSPHFILGGHWLHEETEVWERCALVKW